MLILRPGFQEISAGSAAQLTAAFLFAGSFLLAKRLTQRESSEDILVMLSIFCTLALLPGALYVWQTPSWSDIGWLAGVAVFATAGHYTITRAIAEAPLTVTQPLSFLQLVWAVLFGYWLFDETPDSVGDTGSALIIVGCGQLHGAPRSADRRACNRLLRNEDSVRRR